MKAAVLQNTGEIENLKTNLVISDIPAPKLRDENDVLVRINFASVNHRDLWISKGKYSKIKLPVVPGSDGAGKVISVGRNVKDFGAGDEVVINPGFDWGDNEDFQSRNFRILGMPDNGTFEETICVNENYVFKKPAALDLKQASAFPLAGVTAFRALFIKAKIKEEDKILITGIGGGAASLALSFAGKISPNVFVTSGSNEKIRKAIEHGAANGVNHTNENWTDELKEMSRGNIDVVIDSSGGNTFSKCIDLCSYGARIVTFGATNGLPQTFDIYKVYWKQLKIFGTMMGSKSDFRAMIEFIEKHNVHPVIDSEYVLEQIHEAFIRMNASDQFGKIILEI